MATGSEDRDAQACRANPSLLTAPPDLGLGLKPKLQVASGWPSVLFPKFVGARTDLLLDVPRLSTLPQLLLQIIDPRPQSLHGRGIVDTRSNPGRLFNLALQFVGIITPIDRPSPFE